MFKTALCATASALLLIASGTAVLAGDYNNAIVLQVSPGGTAFGNNLTIDQSLAAGSEVRGIGNSLALLSPLTVALLSSYDLSGNSAALQIGESNDAEITLTGAGAEAELLQAGGTPNNGNIARLIADGNSLGGILQTGLRNDATLTLDDSDGLIIQIGSDLYADLDVGTGGTGVVTQIGNGSTTGDISVAAGNSLSYTQIGNNLSPVNAVNGVSVSSTLPVQVTIVQSSYRTISF